LSDTAELRCSTSRFENAEEGSFDTYDSCRLFVDMSCTTDYTYATWLSSSAERRILNYPPGNIELVYGTIDFTNCPASTDTRELDYYQEGSWTPVLDSSGGVSGQTYTSQFGYYVRIGGLVTATFRLNCSDIGSVTTGNAIISGLPFAASSTSGQAGAVSIGRVENLNAAIVNIHGYVDAGDDYISIRQILSAADTDDSVAPHTTWTNTTYMLGTVTYMTAP